MSRNHFKHVLSLSCVIAAAFLLFQGCESAEVDEASAAASSSGGGSGGGGSGGGTTYQTIAVNPATATHRTVGYFTVLEINGMSGYTYRWTMSDSSIGSLSPTTGTRVTYTTTSVPASGSVKQTITVKGTSSSSSVVYQGTSVITHQAN